MHKGFDFFDFAPAGCFVLDGAGVIVEVNRTGATQFGTEPEALRGTAFASLVAASDQTRLRAHLQAVTGSDQRQALDLELLRNGGGAFRGRLESKAVRDDSGAFLQCNSILIDGADTGLIDGIDAEADQAAGQFQAGQRRVLEMLATDAKLPEVLTALVLLIEGQVPGMLASILLLDDEGKHLHEGAAPNLPEAYNRAIDGLEIGPAAGSCGTAAYRGEQVIASDIQSDPLWANYRHLASAHDLAACWSTPIRLSDGEVVGTFAMYYHEPRTPGPREQNLIQAATHIAGIAVEHERAMKNTLRLHREERFHEMVDALPAAIYTTDAEGRITHFNPAAIEYAGRVPVLGTDRWCVTAKLFYPDGSPMRHDECPMALSLKEGRALRGSEAIAERPDGRRIWFEAYPTPLRDGKGNVVGGINMLIDVTERKQAEKALARTTAETEHQKRFYEAILSSTPDLVYAFDLNYRFTYVNEAVLQMWGRTLAESVGKELLEVGYEPWHAEMHEREIDQVVATKRPVRGMVSFPHATLGKRVYDYIFVPVLNAEGEVESVAGTTRDITDIRLAEEALREGEERFRVTFEQAAVGISHTTPDGRWLRANQRFQEITGYTPEDLSRLTFQEITYPEDRKESLQVAQKLLDGQIDTAYVEKRYIRKDGSIIWANLTTTLKRDAAGAPEYFISVTEDISDRKQMQEALLVSEQRLREVFERAPAAIAVLRGPDHIFEAANPLYLQLTGKQYDMLGKSVAEVLPEVVEQGFTALLDRVYQTGEPYTANEQRVLLDRNGDGKLDEVFLNFVYQPLFEADGSVSGIFVHAVDVTAQVRAREAVKESETRALLALEVAEQGTWSWDPERDVVVADARCREICGLDPEGALTLADIAPRVHADDWPRIEAALTAALQPEGPGRYAEEFRFAHADGTVRWVISRGQTLFVDEGPARRPTLMLGSVLDVTERKEAEEELKELNEALEERVAERTLALEGLNLKLVQQNRELQDFAYVASHDLQEPLRKISTFADLLQTDKSDALDDTGKFYIQRMRASAGRMSGLIRDLLSFSRVATHGESFRVIDLDQVLSGVLSDLEVSILESGAEIEATPLPQIEADPLQMRQLFQNIIGNALKFHRPGTQPRIRVRGLLETGDPSADAEDQPVCRLTVEDNGVGFDEKYVDRIFAPFQRLHGKSEYPGTGIGLAICRRIVERHHGTITAHSTPGEGSTFVITLPARQHVQWAEDMRIAS